MKSRKTVLMIATALLTISLAGCDSPEDKEAKYIHRGNDLYDKGEYDKARLEYKNAARLVPVDAEVRYRLGLVDEAQGNLQNAFGNFIAAEQQNAHHRLALLKLAQYFLAGDMADEAQKRLNLLLTDDPSDSEAHALAAAAHLRRKELDAVEPEVRKAFAKDPANATAFSVLTGLYVAQNNMAQAEATIEDGVQRNPQNVGLLLLKATIFQRASNLDKVTEAYHTIFSLRPTERRYRNELAQVYVQADKVDDAEKVLRDGVAAMPDDWDMKKRLVAFLNEKRGLPVAEQVIKDYMKAYPDNQELVFWLADLYISNKAIDRAVALLQEVVRESPEEGTNRHSLNAKTSLARIHFAKGDRVLAERLTDAVLQADPNNRDALLVKARMLVAQGDYQQAVVVLRTIVRDKPDAADALQLLGESLLAQGYIDLAIDTFSQLVQVAPTNMPAKVRLAQLLSAHGEPDRALALLAMLTKYEPSYPVGWESTARIAIDAKNWNLAEDAIKQLEALPDQARTATFLRGQIAVAHNKPDEAMALFKQVIAPDVTSPIAGHALRELVDLALAQGKLTEIISYLETFGPSSPQVAILLGRCYLEQGRKDAAAAAYDRAIAAQTTDVEAYLARAQIDKENNKIDAAMQILAKADDLSHADLRPLMARADLTLAAGHPQEALVLYETALARNPRADAAANNAAQLIADYMQNDQAALEKARILAERFIRSPSPYFLDTLAWVYFRQGRDDQAQTIFERIMASDQALPAPVYYHYGLLLLKRGRTGEAKQAFEKAVKTDQPYTGLEQAKAALSSL